MTERAPSSQSAWQLEALEAIAYRRPYIHVDGVKVIRALDESFARSVLRAAGVLDESRVPAERRDPLPDPYIRNGYDGG